MRTAAIIITATLVFLLLLGSAVILGGYSRFGKQTVYHEITKDTGITTTTTTVDNTREYGTRGTITIDKDTDLIVLPDAPAQDLTVDAGLDVDSRRLEFMVTAQSIADRAKFKLEWIRFTDEPTETWDQAVVLFTDCKEKQCVPYKMTYEWKGVSHDEGEWNLVER